MWGASRRTRDRLPTVDDHRDYMGGYFQDDWKATPNLTLNLGLRSILLPRTLKETDVRLTSSQREATVPRETTICRRRPPPVSPIDLLQYLGG